MKMKRSSSPLLAALFGLMCAFIVMIITFGAKAQDDSRSELAFANANEYLNGFVWTAPYPGAGPETPAWEKTPASVGQDAVNANDAARRESNVLNTVEFPDYSRGARNPKMTQKLSLTPAAFRSGSPFRKPVLWVGSPQQYLPPDGDYPGGATGIPEDGYIAYETGYADDGPFHGELAPMQEAGIASAVMDRRGQLVRRKHLMLSILDPGSQPAPFNDWDVGNFGAPLDKTYRPEIWDNPDTQPLDWINAGKLTCVMGSDCHDNTHQGGVHDNGNQYYDNFFTGSIDPNSDKSVNAEYARSSRKHNRMQKH